MISISALRLPLKIKKIANFLNWVNFQVLLSGRNPHYGSAYLDVALKSRLGALEYCWKGRISDEQAREGIKILNKILKQVRINSLVADLTDLAGFSMQMAIWMNEVWREHLLAVGVENIAVIMPRNPYGAFTHMLVTDNKFSALLNVEQFDCLPEARSWVVLQKQFA